MDLTKTTKRLRNLVEDVEPRLVPAKEKPEEKTEALHDVFRTTFAMVCEQAPEGTTPEDLGDLLLIGLQEVADKIEEEPAEIFEKFRVWMESTRSAFRTLEESIKEDA